MTFDTTAGGHRITKEELEVRALEQSERGDWQASIDTNQAIIALDGGQASTYNRLGRSLMKLGRMSEALRAYEQALRLDPANVIARRNEARLRQLLGLEEGVESDTANSELTFSPASSIEVRADDFVMETGRSALIALEDLADPREVASTLPGDALELRPDGAYLRVYNTAGVALGVIPARIAQRLRDLMSAGNQYSAVLFDINAQGIRVLVRETFRSPETHGKLPFPQTVKLAADRSAARGTKAAVPAEEEQEPDVDVDDDDTDETEDATEEPLRETDTADEPEE